MASSFLKVLGTKLVDGEGQEVILRGAGLGGWMNMENFISGQNLPDKMQLWSRSSLHEGYPGREFQIREALAQVIGEKKSALFFDKV